MNLVSALAFEARITVPRRSSEVHLRVFQVL